MPSLYETTPETGTVSSTNLTSLYSNTSNFTTGVVNSSVYSVNGGTGVIVNPTTGNVVVSIGQDVATSANVTFANVTATGNLSNNYFTLVNSAGTNGQVLTTNGAGVTTWTTPSSLGLVTSITGTANQVIASSPTGAVTLSTPQDIATTSNPTFAGATLGNVTVGIVDNNTISTTSGNLVIGDATNTTDWPVINSGTNTNPVFIQRFTTSTSGVARSLALNVQSSGTPTVGFGNSLEFQLEAQPGNTERAGFVSVVSTDLTATSEDFRMIFGLMQNGASVNTKAELDSAGNFTADGRLGGAAVDIYDGSGFIGVALDVTAPTTTSATTPNQVVATVGSIATYRTIKFIVQATSGTAYQSTEILLIHDGTTAYLNTYSDVRTGANLTTTFDADISGSNIRLLVTPVNAVTTYKTSITAVTV